MKKTFLAILFFTIITLSGFSQTIKIGTVAPTGSLWDTTLKEIAAEWGRISNGRIRVKIYTGGTVGNENDIVRKIKLGRLQGAALTSQGVANIDPDLVALSLPMIISDDDEFDYVFKKIIPTFNKKLDKSGFTAMGWTMSGWVNWFTTDPVYTPSDLKKLKIAVDNSDGKIIQVWKKVGFKVIPLSLTDLMSGLYSGMAEGTYITPYAASAMGLAELTPYMNDMPISPLYGTLIINNKTWRQIKDEYKDEMLDKTAEILEEFYSKMKHIENEGLEVMKSQGLTVNHGSDANRSEWVEIVNEGVGIYVDEMISDDIYSELNSYINEYENQ